MSSEIQSVIFKDTKYTTAQARSWLHSHGLKPLKNVDHEHGLLHYRIHNPDKYSKIRTKTTNKGISLRIGFK